MIGTVTARAVQEDHSSAQQSNQKNPCLTRKKKTLTELFFEDGIITKLMFATDISFVFLILLLGFQSSSENISITLIPFTN